MLERNFVAFGCFVMLLNLPGLFVILSVGVPETNKIDDVSCHFTRF